MHQIPKLKWFSYRPAVVFAQPIEAMLYIWVLSNFITYSGGAYIRGLTVCVKAKKLSLMTTTYDFN